ncbi:MAG: chemotaxis protein [Betaproteobacteria bacterium]|jgi:two-component system chemotaxis response regulator CheV
MSDLLKTIDARTKLAGTNKLEILLFSLGTDGRTGRRETYGINVFKVREVMRSPEITRAPDMPSAVEGMVSLRGVLVPVIDLAKYSSIPVESPPNIMVVTEYNGRTQGFLVEAVDTILRLDWAAMRVPPEMLVSNLGGLVTAVTELPDGRLVMMLDVEKILAETARQDDDHLFQTITSIDQTTKVVLFADDSPVARKQIQRTLDAMGVRYISAVNGGQAWQELERLCSVSVAARRPLTDFVNVILTDVEMPEMDGYMLTKQIKSDARTMKLPVIMHSSLSGMQNQQLGKSVGVDDYVSKFEPQKLADTITRLLKETA